MFWATLRSRCVRNEKCQLCVQDLVSEPLHDDVLLVQSRDIWTTRFRYLVLGYYILTSQCTFLSSHPFRAYAPPSTRQRPRPHGWPTVWRTTEAEAAGAAGSTWRGLMGLKLRACGACGLKNNIMDWASLFFWIGTFLRSLPENKRGPWKWNDSAAGRLSLTQSSFLFWLP